MESISSACKRLLKVAIIGAPNAGKSTLLNRLVGNEVSCVSNKVHTTRRNILGVYTEDKTQLEFFDSPGLVTREHLHKHRLEDSLLNDPNKAAQTCNLIAVVVDAGNIRERKRMNRGILKILRDHSDKESMLILNKVDLLKEKRQLLDVTTRLTQGCLNGECTFSRRDLRHMSYDELRELNLISNLNLKEVAEEDAMKNQHYKHVTLLDKKGQPPEGVDIIGKEINSLGKSKFKYFEGVPGSFEDPDLIGYSNFSQVFSISALNDEGVDQLRRAMLDSAEPVEDWPHGPDYLTNQTTKDLAHSIIRGQVMNYARFAAPYTVKYRYLQCQFDDLGNLHIDLILLCPQKYIVGNLIGDKGINIFRIIEDSRDSIAKTLACDVRLNIDVKLMGSR